MDFYERFKALCNEIGKTPTGVGKELGVDGSTVNYWKNGHTPTQRILAKIASYFKVSIDYLCGKTDIRNSPESQAAEDIAKVALFGGDGEVTDEMWEEVKGFVAYLKSKHMKGT